MGTRNKLWILVNTDEITWMLVAIIFCHQVPMILLGPTRWTVIPGRHHQHRATWLDEADNTWCFMIMEIFLKKGFRCDHLLHIQCRTCIRSSDGHLCTCHTLDCVEGRGSSLHHHGDCSILHPLYLMQGKKFINNYSWKFRQLAKLSFSALRKYIKWRLAVEEGKVSFLYLGYLKWRIFANICFHFLLSNFTLISRQLNSSC